MAATNSPATPRIGILGIEDQTGRGGPRGCALWAPGYAATLAAAGVPVTHRCYPGLIHGSFSMTPVIPAAAVMMDDAAAALRPALSERSAIPERSA
ncbi:MAG TPA: hypothetical protein VGI06_02775 [Acidimicrobiales bacterium]